MRRATSCASASRKCVVVLHTNDYALLNPDRREAVDLVKRMQEDLEYFRKHAMTNPNRSRDAKPDGDGEPQPDEVVAAEPETSL